MGVGGDSIMPLLLSGFLQGGEKRVVGGSYRWMRSRGSALLCPRSLGAFFFIFLPLPLENPQPGPRRTVGLQGGTLNRRRRHLFTLLSVGSRSLGSPDSPFCFFFFFSPIPHLPTIDSRVNPGGFPAPGSTAGLGGKSYHCQNGFRYRCDSNLRGRTHAHKRTGPQLCIGR